MVSRFFPPSRVSRVFVCRDHDHATIITGGGVCAAKMTTNKTPTAPTGCRRPHEYTAKPTKPLWLTMVSFIFCFFRVFFPSFPTLSPLFGTRYERNCDTRPYNASHSNSELRRCFEYGFSIFVARQLLHNCVVCFLSHFSSLKRTTFGVNLTWYYTNDSLPSGIVLGNNVLLNRAKAIPGTLLSCT